MNGKMIGVLLLALLLMAIASYFVFRQYGCPNNNHTSLEQYRNKKPALSNQFIVDDNQKAIANILVPMWLGWFASRNADSGIRLNEYEIHKIDVGQWQDNKFLASATLSVKPVTCSYKEWLTGNGEESGDWVKNKFLYFTIIKEDDNYKVESVETRS